MSAEKHDLSLMTLHVGDVIGLFIYYAIMLLGSLGITIEQIAKTSAIADMGQFDAILTVLSSSVCGSTIFYSRKLYKAAINSSYDFLRTNSFTTQRVGTISFFVFRPIFGAALSIVVYSLWRASIHASTDGGSTPKEFVFIIVPMGFLSGFSAGKLIAQFEDRSLSDLTKANEDR